MQVLFVRKDFLVKRRGKKRKNEGPSLSAYLSIVEFSPGVWEERYDMYNTYIQYIDIFFYLNSLKKK